MSLFDTHRRREVESRLLRVRVEVAAALVALRARGVEVELVGSLVNGNFKIHSDVDFLITHSAGLSAGALLDCITDQLRSAKADVVFADALTADALVLMRGT